MAKKKETAGIVANKAAEKTQKEQTRNVVRPSASVSAPDPAKQVRQVALNKLIQANTVQNDIANRKLGRGYTYLTDPNADKYILESFNRGNPLSKVSGGASSNAMNTGLPDWSKDLVRSQTIPDYLDERAKNLTTAIGDFVTGYQNPYKQQIRDTDREALAYMSEDEQKEYSYLLGKDSINGTHTAKEYADSLRNKNVYKEALRRFKNYQNANAAGRLAHDIADPFVAGIDNATQGATKRFANFVTGKNEVEDPSVMENYFGMMSESAANNGNKLPLINHTPEEVLQNIAFMQGNMAPSQLAGGVGGMLGAGEKVAAAIGASAMFPQVAGSAYNETLRETGDVDKARLYALASGMNEAAGEYLLGGVENVSGGFINDWATKNLPKQLAKAEGKTLMSSAAHALARALSNPITGFIMNGAQEGMEEIVQGTVDTVLRNAILNEDNKVDPFSEDNLYSAFVAALSVYGSNLAPSIANTAQRNAFGNQAMEVYRDMGLDYQTLADSMPVSDADYTSQYGLVDKQKRDAALEAQALAQSLAEKEKAGVKIKGSEKADLAEAISNVQDNVSEHIGNKLRAQDLEMKPMRDAEMVENVRGGFDESGKTAFDSVSGDKIQKARPFAAYYNMGRFGTQVSENMQQAAQEVGMTSEEISSAMRAGAADANNLFPTKATTEMQKIMKNIKAKGRQGTATFEGVNYNDLTTQQKLRVDFSQALLNKALGMDVRFIQSNAVDGKYVGANGAYETINGRPTITLDVNAGMNYESDWTGQMTDIKTLLPTVSHELTHYLEKANKDAYQQIAQTVVGALQKSGKYSRGLSFNEILNAERTRLDNVEQRTHTNDDALHEIVARACEDMLSGNKVAMQAFENLDANTKKTIADHIKEIFDNIRDFFEQMLTGYRSDSAEARAIRQNMEEFEKIRDMWNKALGDITETVPAADVVEETTADQPVQAAFSMRQFAKALDYDLVFNSEGIPFKIVDPATGEAVTHVTLEQMKQTSMGTLVQAALENGTIDSKTADEQLKMFADLMNLTLRYDEASLPMIWEIAGSYLFSSVKTNADAQYATTIDYGTICSKTQALIDVLSNTMVKKGRGLTRDEVIAAYNKTANQGLSVPCPVCYVFSRWMGVPSLLETMSNCQERFGNESEAEIQAYIKRMIKEYGDAKAINNEKTKVQNKMATLERNLQKAIADKDLAKQKQIAKETQDLQQKLNDLESFNWVTQVRCKPNGKGYTLDRAYKPVPKDVLFDLRKSDDFASKYPKSWKYRTTRGAGMGKAIMPYSGASLGDFIKGNKDRWVEAKNPFTTKNAKAAKNAVARAITRAKCQNLIGGQRFQSTSDYRAEWGIDYLMTFLECQAAGSQVQLYTKVIEAVDLFATAGAEVNLSIMPKDNGYIVHKDGTKELVFSNVTGVDFNEAYKKVQQYDNVQMILVGINDEHIRLAMADDRIGFIIPWHSSGNSKETLKTLMKAVGETLDVGTNVDYSDYQTDKVIDNSPRMQRLRQFRKEIIQGKLWANYGSRQAKVLTAEERSLLDENPYLADLYRRFYQDTSAQEYGLKLNGKQASSIFPYEYWDKSLTVKDADINGRRFQEYCASLGLQPRFVEKFGNDPGYWKLLIDRSMYNNDGTYHAPNAIDVTNVQIEQMPMEVNSNNYKDMSKISQATMDTLMALDDAKDDLAATDDVYTGEIVEDGAEDYGGVEYSHRVTATEKLPGTDINLLDYLNQQIENGEYITTYKAFLKVGNQYYSPMATFDVDEEKNVVMRTGIEIHEGEENDWLASDGKLTPEKAASMPIVIDPTSPYGFYYGKYNLVKGDENGNKVKNGDVEAAYNPYQHSSNLVVNDQFATYYKRPGVVVVECRIPLSEINNPYWAPYAKDATGKHEWKSGMIAGQLEKTDRDVYMTRYIQPVRELSHREVAEKIRDYVLKEEHWVNMYFNDLHPEVAKELEKMGIEIDQYGDNSHIKNTAMNNPDRFGNRMPVDLRDRVRAEREPGRAAREARSNTKEAKALREKFKTEQAAARAEAARVNRQRADEALALMDRGEAARIEAERNRLAAKEAAKAEERARKKAKKNKQYSMRGDYAPTFYSKLQQEIGNFKGDKIGAASVESYLKGKGVKDEEIKWSGIRQYLEGKKSVNKQELMDYLKANELVIEEKTLGRNPVFTEVDAGDNAKQFSSIEEIREYYESKYGEEVESEDYDEYMDQYSFWIGDDEFVFNVSSGDDNTHWSGYSLKGGANYREILFKIPNSDYSNLAMNAHWGEQGVLAHARVQDFTSEDGGKVLFVEEIQSDWHNEGQSKGYRKYADREDYKGWAKRFSEDKAIQGLAKNLRKSGGLLYHDIQSSVIYSLRQNIEDAVRNGTVEKLPEFYKKAGNYDLSPKEIKAINGFAESYSMAVENEGTPDAPFRDSYTNFVLKDLLRMAAEGDYDYLAWTPGAMQEQRWSKEYAEGYRIEYDQDIPKFLKKYGKQWGAGLTEIQLDTGYTDDDGNPRFDGNAITQTVPAIDVNDAMKESVLYAGQPMFSQRNVDLDQRLDELVQKYGAHPKGEKAVKDVAVPEQTSDGKRVRRYVRTVLESGVTSDMMDDEIKAKILKEGLSYEPVTDKDAGEYAASVLRIGGVERAQKEWNKARSETAMTKDAMAVGQELLREYAKQGDVENVVKMVTELAAEGTRAGQTIQAMRMLKKYATESPEIGLGYIQKTVDIMNREAKAKMGKRYKEMKIDQRLADEYVKASTKDQIDAALGKIYKNLGSQVQKTAGEEVIDRLRTWRYSAMLGNPRTHVRNFVGNALFVPAVTMKNAIGSVLEAGAKQKTKSLFTTKAARQFAAQDALEMRDLLQGNADKSIRQLIEGERKTFTNPLLNKFTKLNGDALEYEDWIFLRYHYQNALAQYLSANKLNPNALDGKELAKARQYAVKEAQKATYRDANKVSTWLNQSHGAGAVVKYMMEGMMPFKKTPTNILRRGIEYSPAMIVERLTKGIYDLNKGNITVNEWIDGLASGLTGTALFGLGMFLASTGAVLGGYGDDDEKKKKKLKGEQEYAAKIGDYTYTIDWAAPAALPLFIGVETMYGLRKDGNFNMDDMSKAVARLIDPMINMSMLQGLNDTLDAISYSDDKLSALTAETVYSLLGQYVPTILGQVARTIDTTQRVNYQDANKGMSKNMLYFLEKMQNKIPYMTFSNDPYLDEFGRKNVTESRMIAFIQNFISPGYIKKSDNDRVVKAVTRLSEQTEEDVLPKKMPKYIGTKEDRMDLTSRQYYRFQRDAGTMSYNIIDNMLDDDRYIGLDADQQAAAIKMGYDYAKAAARKELQPEYELKGDSKKIYEAYENDGTLPYDTILNLSMLHDVTDGVTGDKDENGKTIQGSEKKNTIEAILNSSGTASDKAKMYEMSYPEDKVYKKWRGSNYSGVDYMKHYSAINNFHGDKKQESVIDYIKHQTDNIDKQKLMWEIAGYKLDSEKGGVVTTDGNFNKKMGYK